MSKYLKKNLFNTGYITSDDFINFKKWIPKLRSRIKQRFHMVIDLSNFAQFLSMIHNNTVLDKIWNTMDHNNDGKIAVSDLRLLFHSILEKYAQYMGLQKYINVEAFTPMVDSLCHIFVKGLQNSTFESKEENEQEYITYEQFERLSNALMHVKSQTFETINLMNLTQFVSKLPLDNIWQEFDPQNSGAISSVVFEALMNRILQQYIKSRLPTSNLLSNSIASISYTSYFTFLLFIIIYI